MAVGSGWRWVAVGLALGVHQAAARPVMKWVYPAPRTSQSDLTTGPCGDVDDESRIKTTMSPGWTTVAFHETFNASNTYIGGNFRIALSGIGANGTRDIDSNPEDCVLLDHIPSSRETEAYNYTINIQVPNIKCDRCTLQLLYVVPRAGNPVCDYNDARFKRGGVPLADDCQDVFFSCALVRITGRVPREGATCSVKDIQAEWPMQPGEPMLCDDAPAGGDCEEIPERPLFRYSKCRGEWDDLEDDDAVSDFAWLDDRQRGDDGERKTIDSIFRTQQFKGFGTGDEPSVGKSMDKQEQPINKQAAGASVAGIFAVAAIFILIIHLQTHGKPTCNWLNEGGLPPGKTGHNRAASDYSQLVAAKSPMGKKASAPPPPPRKSAV